MTPPFVSRDWLLQLAPQVLCNNRNCRYHGDDVAVPLNQFLKPDQESILNLYHLLQELFAVLKDENRTGLAEVQSKLENAALKNLFEEVAHLGESSYQICGSPLMGRAIHDIRGGGLAPLLGYLQLKNLRERAPGAQDMFYFLTRDHLKIMRNAVRGLDEDGRRKDLEIKMHSTDLVIAKWHGAKIRSTSGFNVQVEVDCPEAAEISECCIEFGAFDRILYNLFNNACRHVEDGMVWMALLPVPDGRQRDLRVVLLNALTELDRQRLERTDLMSLFEPNVSTTGSGFGLTIAAELVAKAYGLSLPEDAVRGRYVGINVEGGSFVTWFHWPIVKRT